MKPVNAEVQLGGKIRNFEQLIRAFSRKIKKVGLIREVRSKIYYESKGQKRRRKKHASQKRSQRKGG